MHCRVSIPKSIEFKFKLGLEQRIGGFLYLKIVLHLQDA